MSDIMLIAEVPPRAKSTRQRFTVDLKEVKKPWLEFCAQQGANPSDFTRKVLQRLLASQQAKRAELRFELDRNAIEDSSRRLAAAVPDAISSPSKRLELRLSESEYNALTECARAARETRQAYTVATLRAAMSTMPRVTETDREIFIRSNTELRSIGRNLNQIAKALNAGSPGAQVTLATIAEARAAIEAHVVQVAGHLQASGLRYALKKV